MSNNNNLVENRRSFLKNSGIALIGSTLAYHAGMGSPLFTSGKSTIKVGLIGCGGRGTGAAAQALQADPDVVIAAMGDVFEDRLEESYQSLISIGKTRVNVDKNNRFIGFDAYKRVLDSGVDVVLLTTPPAFRPDHLAAAINANKHVFCEKPVAVDASGVRKVLIAAKLAKSKGLSLVSGFCLRYDQATRAAFGKVLQGDLGNIRTVSSVRNGGELWTKPRQPGWSEMTYQMRNWYYYNWLSGDFIVEQAVHSLDMMSWAMGDNMPVKATGTGGRQVRVDEIYGNIYDHFAVEFDYADGAKGYHFTRQQTGTAHSNTVTIMGTDGDARISIGSSYEITGKNKWKYAGPDNDMYQTQHDELFASIRSGKPVNDGEWMANSSMLAIWARMAGYTGQSITWEEAINSTEVLGPETENYHWDLVWKVPPVAKPGITKFS